MIEMEGLEVGDGDAGGGEKKQESESRGVNRRERGRPRKVGEIGWERRVYGKPEWPTWCWMSRKLGGCG